MRSIGRWAIFSHKVAVQSGGSAARAVAAEDALVEAGTHPAPTTPPTIHARFEGMANSTAICQPIGCAPPDQALAASPSWVFQGVNTSFAVYDIKGKLQAGWPKSAQTFFGVPDYCGARPGLTDPRAFYDPNDGRFWAAMLQVGDQTAGCGKSRRVWIAVSQTGDPTGKWNSYSFDIEGSTGLLPDFTEVGFDEKAVYMAVNGYGDSQGGFQSAVILGANKKTMETGGTLAAAYGFRKLAVGGVQIDTVHPALTLAAPGQGPGVEYFASSLDINSGLCEKGCSGAIVWAMAGGDTTTPKLSAKFVPTATYTLAPAASSPGNQFGIFTGGTNIQSTPVYRGGVVTFTLTTGITVAGAPHVGVYWAQVKPALTGTTLTGATLVQQGTIAAGADQDALYGTPMVDSLGNILIAFDRSGTNLSPEFDYTVHRTTDAPGTTEPFVVLRAAKCAPGGPTRWGDYAAAGLDGLTSDNIWIASEYAGICPVATGAPRSARCIFDNPRAPTLLPERSHHYRLGRSPIGTVLLVGDDNGTAASFLAVRTK